MSKKQKLKYEDFESHGHWSDNGTHISYMWKHKPTGEMYYEDVPKVREKELKIYPFLSREV